MNVSISDLNILDLELPEIEGRDLYTPSASLLDKSGPESWGEKPGRRISNALLVNKLREAFTRPTRLTRTSMPMRRPPAKIFIWPAGVKT